MKVLSYTFIYEQATVTKGLPFISQKQQEVVLLSQQFNDHMNMLNPFPFLLDYQFYGPALLRIVLGFYVVWLGGLKLPKSNPELIAFFESMGLRPSGYYLYPLAVAEIIAGMCFILGFITQIAAGIVAIISLVSLIVSARQPNIKMRPPLEYMFVLTISLALLVMGAGRVAFDWPL